MSGLIKKKLPMNRKLILTVVFLLICGCATAPTSNEAETKVFSPQPEANIVSHVPIRQFDLASIVKDNKQPILEVNFAKPGEISGVSHENVLKAFAISNAIGILLAFPTVGQSLAFGPAATIGVMVNNANLSTVSRAMEQTDFPNRLKEFLRTGISARFHGEPSSSIKVQLVLIEYGIFGEDGNVMFFYCDGQLKVIDSGGCVFEDPVVWQARKRSRDLPPPRYASLGGYAQNDGELVRDVLIEAAEVMAAAIGKRLEVTK